MTLLNAALAEECAKTFDSVVDIHTSAVENRDLESYIATIAPRSEQMMILPNGSYFESLDEISDWHKEWFTDTSWSFNKSLGCWYLQHDQNTLIAPE